jgi:hypothetical protein
MVSPETTPAPIAETKRKLPSRRLLYLFAAVVLAATAAVLVMRFRTDPLERRLVGVWALRSSPQFSTYERMIEFHKDGRFWVYPKGQRDVESDPSKWRISGGDFVMVNEDPLNSKGVSIGGRLREMSRRIGDPFNDLRSSRYAVKDEGGGTITLTLIEEWGAAPKKAAQATLTRAAEQSSP